MESEVKEERMLSGSSEVVVVKVRNFLRISIRCKKKGIRLVSSEEKNKHNLKAEWKLFR